MKARLRVHHALWAASAAAAAAVALLVAPAALETHHVSQALRQQAANLEADQLLAAKVKNPGSAKSVTRARAAVPVGGAEAAVAGLRQALDQSGTSWRDLHLVGRAQPLPSGVTSQRVHLSLEGDARQLTAVIARLAASSPTVSVDGASSDGERAALDLTLYFHSPLERR